MCVCKSEYFGSLSRCVDPIGVRCNHPADERGGRGTLHLLRVMCNAIAQYIMYHDEKFAGMGSEDQAHEELAAFLAHAAMDSNGLLVMEEPHCVDPITGSDGRVYCKPCKEEHYTTIRRQRLAVYRISLQKKSLL